MKVTEFINSVIEDVHENRIKRDREDLNVFSFKIKKFFSGCDIPIKARNATDILVKLSRIAQRNKLVLTEKCLEEFTGILINFAYDLPSTETSSVSTTEIILNENIEDEPFKFEECFYVSLYNNSLNVDSYYVEKIDKFFNDFCRTEFDAFGCKLLSIGSDGTKVKQVFMYSGMTRKHVRALLKCYSRNLHKARLIRDSEYKVKY